MFVKHIAIGLISMVLVSGTLVLEAQGGKPVQLKTGKIVEVIEAVKARGAHRINDQHGAASILDKLTDQLTLQGKKNQEAITYLTFPLENVSYYLVISQEGKALENLEIAEQRFSEVQPHTQEGIRDEVWQMLRLIKYEIDNTLLSAASMRADEVVSTMLMEFFNKNHPDMVYYLDLVEYGLKRIPKIFTSLESEAVGMMQSQLETYTRHLNRLANAGVEVEALVKKHTQVLYAFVIQQPSLMRLSVFEKLSAFESLATYDTATRATQGIALLNVTKEMLESEKIGLQEAQKLNTFFIQKSELTEEYIERKEPELSVFLEFLKTPEYAHMSGSMREKFEKFKEDRAHSRKILDIVDELRPNKSEEKSVEEGGQLAQDILEQVREDLSQQRVKNPKLEIIDEKSQNPLVEVEAEVNKMAFSGIYNVQRKSFPKITIKGETITQAVPLNKLRLLLIAKNRGINRMERVRVEEEVRPEKTSIESIGRSVVKNELTKRGFSVEDEQIDILDFERGIFAVDTKVATFTLQQKKGFVEDLVIHSGIGDVEVQGSVSYDELIKRILKVTELVEDSI